MAIDITQWLREQPETPTARTVRIHAAGAYNEATLHIPRHLLALARQMGHEREAPRTWKAVELRDGPQQQFMARLHRLRRGVLHAFPAPSRALGIPLLTNGEEVKGKSAKNKAS